MYVHVPTKIIMHMQRQYIQYVYTWGKQWANSAYRKVAQLHLPHMPWSQLPVAPIRSAAKLILASAPNRVLPCALPGIVRHKAVNGD